MKRIFAIISVILSVILLCSCSAHPDSTQAGGEKTEIVETGEAVSADFSADASEMFSDRDLNSDYHNEKCAQIKLSDSGITSTTDAVTVTKSTVTVSDEGTYVFSGELSDGGIVVDADSSAKLRIVLNGVTVNSTSQAPLCILCADKVVVTLAKGTKNVLSNGGEFATLDGNNVDGAIFSKEDLTINGTGALDVISPAGHGIVCKDDLVLAGGEISVQSASHGIDANDSVRITAAALSVEAEKDAVHSENEEDSTKGFVYILDGKLCLSGEGDGISASAHMQIEDGEFDIVTGGGWENGKKQTSDSWGGFPGGPGGRSYDEGSMIESTSTDSGTSIKGLKAGGGMLVNGGSFKVDSADDTLHSNADLSVNGGTFALSSGDDALHADGTLSVTAGDIEILESYEGLEGLHIKVSGGSISLCASDDGFNAAGGNDSSGFGGGRGDMFGGRGGRGDMFGGRGGMGGMSTGSSDGSIAISGGDIYINASGDGIDANGTFEMSGGYTVVCGPVQGDTATLDYDISATISGGTFIGTGGAGMAQSFSASEQGVIAINTGNQPAETKIILEDSDGDLIAEYAPELPFGVVIISTPKMVSGEEYKLTVGSQSKTFTAE